MQFRILLCLYRQFSHLGISLVFIYFLIFAKIVKDTIPRCTKSVLLHKERANIGIIAGVRMMLNSLKSSIILFLVSDVSQVGCLSWALKVLTVEDCKDLFLLCSRVSIRSGDVSWVRTSNEYIAAFLMLACSGQLPIFHLPKCVLPSFGQADFLCFLFFMNLILIDILKGIIAI